MNLATTTGVCLVCSHRCKKGAATRLRLPPAPPAPPAPPVPLEAVLLVPAAGSSGSGAAEAAAVTSHTPSEQSAEAETSCAPSTEKPTDQTGPWWPHNRRSSPGGMQRDAQSANGGEN